MDSVVVDTIRVIVDEGANIYDLGRLAIIAAFVIILTMCILGNPFRDAASKGDKR